MIDLIIYIQLYTIVLIDEELLPPIETSFQ